MSRRKSFYQAGGTLQPGEGIYIKRPADAELLHLCLQNEYAFVLTARQRGKSSLMEQTVASLKERQVQAAIVNLEELGTRATRQQWYLSVLDIIADRLDLNVNTPQWWKEREHQPEPRRLSQFFEKVVLEQILDPVVIFFDEIDTTISLDFTDDFFIVLRSMYNSRSQIPAFARLSFVFIGVATPAELVKDKTITPFNIGHLVELTDFTFDEALPLADGLGIASEEAKQVLSTVLEWTNGHPYLTMRLLKNLIEKNLPGFDRHFVDTAVSEIFLNPHTSDPNIKMVADRLDPQKHGGRSALRLYYKILTNRSVLDDEESGRDKEDLKLSGIVKVQNGRLVIRNRIYTEIFTREWLEPLLYRVEGITLNVLEQQIRLQEAQATPKEPSIESNTLVNLTAEDTPSMFTGTANWLSSDFDNLFEEDDAADSLADAFAFIDEPVDPPTFAPASPSITPTQNTQNSPFSEESVSAPPFLTRFFQRLRSSDQWLSWLSPLAKRFPGLRSRLMRANSRLKPEEFLLLQFGAMIFAFILAFSLLFPGQIVGILLSGVVGFYIPQIYIGLQASFRLASFEQQIPDFLDSFINHLRSGYSVLQTFESSSRDMPQPTADELKRIVHEVQLGIKLEDALDHSLNRMPSEDFDLVITGINIQREVGGNLAAIMEDIKTMISELYAPNYGVGIRLYLLQALSIWGGMFLAILQWGVFPQYFEPASTSNLSLIPYGLAGLIAIFLAEIAHRIIVTFQPVWLQLSQVLNIGIIGVLLYLCYRVEVPPLLMGWWILILLCMSSPTPMLSLLGAFGLFVVAGALWSADLPTAPTIDPLWIGAIGGVVVLLLLLRYAISIINGMRTRDPLMERLSSYADRELPQSLEEIELELSFQDRVMVPLLERVGKWFPSSRVLQEKLEQAGLHYRLSVEMLQAQRLILGVGSGLITLIITLLINLPLWITFGLSLIAIGCGYWLPIFRVNRAIRRRKQQIDQALLDGILLVKLALEAGLGFDAAIGKVYEKWDNELAIAFGRVLQEMLLGKSRREALRDLGNRMNVPSLSRFTSMVIQADQLSITMSSIIGDFYTSLYQQRSKQIQRNAANFENLLEIPSNLLLPFVLIFWLVSPLIAEAVR